MSVFKNEEVLYPEYLPQALPHRENQIKLIAEKIETIAKNQKVSNIFIFGPPGIGKTAVTKFVLREFENYSGIKCLYLNCWQFNTSFSVLSEILRLLEIFTSRRGLAKDELFFKFVEFLEKSKRNLVIALDEVDVLIKKDQSLLYDFLRIGEYTKQKILLILISNDRYILKNIDERIKSSLSVEEIEFKPYSFLEMKDIVEERMKLAFKSYENGISALVANKAIEKGGDVRIALNILLKAGRLAKDKLTIDIVKEAMKEENSNEKEKFLDEREKMVLECFSQPKTIEQVYEELKGKINVSERTLRRIVDDLLIKKLLVEIGYENRNKLFVKRVL